MFFFKKRYTDQEKLDNYWSNQCLRNLKLLSSMTSIKLFDKSNLCKERSESNNPDRMALMLLREASKYTRLVCPSSNPFATKVDANKFDDNGVYLLETTVLQAITL